MFIKSVLFCAEHVAYRKRRGMHHMVHKDSHYSEDSFL